MGLGEEVVVLVFVGFGVGLMLVVFFLLCIFDRLVDRFVMIGGVVLMVVGVVLVLLVGGFFVLIVFWVLIGFGFLLM